MRITTSRWGTGFIFPLKINNTEIKESKVQKKIVKEEKFINPYQNLDPQPNFTINFIKFITKNYPKVPTPEEILGYIYAILYSNTYRKRYNEFLKTDFPRIPFTKDWKKFRLLSKIGTGLIDTHLLEKDYFDLKLAMYPVVGNNMVDKIKYDKKNSALYINKNQYFKNIPEDVWNMEIGGYKVINTWLKYHKGEELSYNNISHLQKVIRALNETLSIMNDIDQVYIKMEKENF